MFSHLFGKELDDINTAGQVINALVYLMLLYAIAWLSYYGFERRFLAIKKRFIS
jgi:peptidoglycan/LPS O-acetylase OafA/YrhL